MKIFSIYKNKCNIIIIWHALELYNASSNLNYLNWFIFNLYRLLRNDDLTYIYKSKFLFFILCLCCSVAYSLTQDSFFLLIINRCSYKDLILSKGVIVCLVKNKKAFIRCQNIIQSTYCPFFTVFIIKGWQKYKFSFSTKSINFQSIPPCKSIYYHICNNEVLSFTYDVFEILDGL